MSNETAVAVWTPPGLPTKDEFEIMRSMGIQYAKSSGVRDCFRGNAENCFLALSVGREMGVPPTLALAKGYVIEGAYQLEADVLADVIRRNVPGLSWEVLKLDDERCIIEGGIAGGRVHKVEFTFEMAKAAGWTEGKNGIKNQWRAGARQDTMYAKCVRRMVKRVGGLWASMYSVDADEAVVDSTKPVEHERSEAAVVEDGKAAPTPAAPAPAAEPEAKPVAGPVKLDAPVVDWQHRFLAAAAKLWRHEAVPPAHGRNRTLWAKKHGDALLRLVNIYYEERGEKPSVSWSMVPPHDFEPIARWLEARNERAGDAGNGAPAPTDGQPAREEEPSGAPVSAEPQATGAGMNPTEQGASGESVAFPDDDEERPSESSPAGGETEQERLARRAEEISLLTLDELPRAFEAMKFATKGERRFCEPHPSSGNLYLVDGYILKELGLDPKLGQKIANLWSHDATRAMLSRLIAEVEKEIGL